LDQNYEPWTLLGSVDLTVPGAQAGELVEFLMYSVQEGEGPLQDGGGDRSPACPQEQAVPIPAASAALAFFAFFLFLLREKTSKYSGFVLFLYIFPGCKFNDLDGHQIFS